MNVNIAEEGRKWRLKNRWREEELQIIVDNYQSFSDKEIKKLFLPHRPLSSISSKRLEIGCHKKMQKFQVWTPEEIKTLKENYLHYNQRELQAKFFPNKTVEQVRSAKMHRGLKKPPVWTNEQRALLLDHGADYARTELQKKFFPDKTRSQISDMRKHLGIRRNNKVNKH
jgi:hypothetical protein